MASQILISAQESFKNTSILNAFLDPRIFLNVFIQNRELLLLDAELIDIDETHKFRPDKLSYKYWGQELWFPAILVANNLGSVMEFRPELIGNKCLIPKRDNITKILNRIQ